MLTGGFPSIRCVLFDLDGTLLDTATDLLAALNAVLAAEGREPFTLEQARHTISHGSAGMLDLAFGREQLAADKQRRREIFLNYYIDNISHHTVFFAGMEDLLTQLENNGVPWGIVTNKPAYLTDALLRDLDLLERPMTIVSGDTLSVAKPHPEPLLLAARQCRVKPEQCIYVGDAERDIIAGREAGMKTLIAAYGYLDANNEHLNWPADGIIQTPADITEWLKLNG